MSQPNWKLVYATDYSALYEDTTGVYSPELVIAQEIDETPASARFFEVFRFSLDQCALDRADRDDPTARTYLVPASIAGRTDLPHPIPSYQEWFAESLPAIASYVGSSASDLIEALCSPDAATRAEAYEAIGSYHGFNNLDGYPSTWSEAEMKAWPNKGK